VVEFLAVGTLLGLSAGFSPGPLLTLVVSETLRHGVGAGIRVALAPLLTDLPIIAVSLLVLVRLSSHAGVLGLVSLAGAAVVCYLGCECLRTTDLVIETGAGVSRSLRRGVLVNFLSPHPYLFWLSVGAPGVLRARGHSLAAAVAFVGGFYFFLVGSKVFLAWAAGRAGAHLRGPSYRYLMRFLGLGLLLLAAFLLRDGVRLLGVGHGM
jgi:threonine/homoserine/homoserine lactone efflux protein